MVTWPDQYPREPKISFSLRPLRPSSAISAVKSFESLSTQRDSAEFAEKSTCSHLKNFPCLANLPFPFTIQQVPRQLGWNRRGVNQNLNNQEPEPEWPRQKRIPSWPRRPTARRRPSSTRD